MGNPLSCGRSSPEGGQLWKEARPWYPLSPPLGAGSKPRALMSSAYAPLLQEAAGVRHWLEATGEEQDDPCQSLSSM